jgi:uncharacterized membrane protein YbhN (UPF0104 family)/tRNA A-37 threonylcarbamoyl transferase component Bud32
MTTTRDPAAPEEVFAAPQARRPLSPGDVVRLLMGLLLVVVGAVLARAAQATIQGIEVDLIRALGRLPGGIVQMVLSLAQFATSLVTPVVFIVLLVRRRWRVALLLLLASVTASLTMGLADAMVLDRELSEALAGADSGNSLADPNYPNSYVIAAMTAVVTVSTPWLGRRWKRTLWGVVAVLLLLRLVTLAPALDLVLALGVGTVVGSALLLVFGTPTRIPGPGELLLALRSTGVTPRQVRAPEKRDGTLRYDVLDHDGVEWTVVLRTPDERDAELLNRLYRRLRYRAGEVRTPYASVKRRIEHEVLMLALAERQGVRVPVGPRIAETTGGSALYVNPRTALRRATADDLRSTPFLMQLWGQVAALHAVGLAHRHLALEAIRVDEDGRPWLVDFDDGQTSASERERARDMAQLLVETAVVAGPADAVRAAVGTLGPERIAPAMRMLQPLALPSASRHRAKKVATLLGDLRAELIELADAPELELEDLERVKPRTLLIVVVSALAFYSLLPQLANFGDTITAFGNADLWWLFGALVASASTYAFAAVSFQGAVADTVPLLPNLRAQVAASFAALVGPAGAGGFALSGRFLQRLGVSATEAGTSVAVNALAGFFVHVALLAGFIAWTGNASIGSFSLPDSQTVLLVLSAVFAVAGLAALIGPVRRRVLTPLRDTVRTGVSQIGRVFASPQRVIELFGGSLGISLTYVIVVAATVEAFGGGLSFPQVGAAYLGAVAIATLAPTPGGLGALESALIAGFTGFGLEDGIAVSATLTFRLLTFWLPTAPGWLVLNWMQRNDEI